MATLEKVSDNSQDESFAMRAVLYGIRKSFPSVHQLNTETFDKWLKEDEKSLILLDVREIEEYQVSHLSEAKQVKPDESVEQVISRISPQLQDSRNEAIVAYCSVGYRSSAMALKISENLKENDQFFSRNIKVYNLEGSLFKWANEHRTMVDCKNIVTKYCHPYNSIWGKLLQYDLRKYPDK